MKKGVKDPALSKYYFLKNVKTKKYITEDSKLNET